MKNPFNISLKYFAALVVLTIALVFTGTALVSLSYEKAIVRYLNGYLGEHLLTRLSMDENIRFRFLKGFPNTTIEINNVLLLSGTDFSRTDFPGTYSDTLLYARSAFLQFNPFKMLRKKYELKKIEISHGTINILFDNLNHNNLKIWKSEERTSNDYSINLRNIVISGTRLRVISVNENFSLDGQSVRTNFKGNLTSNVLSGETKGHFRIRNLKVKDNILVANSSLQLEIDMIYSGERFRVSRGTVQLNKALANVSGEYKWGKAGEIDLTVDVPQFGLNEVMSVLPGENILSSGIYEFNGNGNLHLVIKGSLANKDRLLISSSFNLDDCTARNKSTRSAVTGLNLSGIISGTNAASFKLDVDTFQAKLGKGNLNGSISVANLKTLQIRLDINAYLDLKEFARFAGIDSVEKMSGYIRSDFQAKGSLKKFKSDSLFSALELVQNGWFEFENAGIRMRSTHLSIENVSGKVYWEEIIQLDSITLKVNETDLLVSGEIKNLKPYLKHEGLLKPNITITCDIIDINNYLNQRVSSSNGSIGRSIFPDDMYIKARVNSKKFIAGKFEASDVLVNLSAVNDSVFLDQFTLKFPDGSITGTALLKSEPGQEYSITCRAEPLKINIQQLFYAFNNFTQHFILDKNMKGLLGGTISFYARWDSALKMIPSSMKAMGDFQITNGELVQFEPMLKLSKYIDVEELRHIRFKTLRNTIYISDRMVSIPEMNIHSSAFNISISGQHSFDNLFDYRLRVLLSEVLYNKARKKKKEIDEFFVEESPADRTTIPLIIAGTPSEFDVKLDRKKAFSLSRNRTVDAQTGEKPVQDNFRVEWEEPPGTPAEKPRETDDPPDVVIEWEE